MTRSVKLALSFLILILSAISAAAQTGCSQTRTYYSGDPAGTPPGAYNFQDLWTYFLYDVKTGCTPASAPVETCPTCPKAAHPIVMSTGNTYIKQTDISIPGLGGGLSLVRAWNSLWPASYAALNVGIFGPNWRSNLEERMLINNDDHYIRYSRGDGSYWSFAFSGQNPDGTWRYYVVAPANMKATLKTGSNWTITFQNGEQRVFDRPDGPLVGKLLSIIDRNGNTTQLTYDVGARLVTVTDAAGRHLNVTYGTGNLSNLVTGVTSDPAAGISLTYTYDPSPCG
jgi:YD repeat-containing protein